MIEIDSLIKGAMKSKNQTELRAYKNLKAEIQTFKTAKNAKPYDEAAEIGIIKKYCDKLSQSIEQFQKAHRQDLAFEYMSEREVLRKLLPEPVNESQIRAALGWWASENGFCEIKHVDEDEYGHWVLGEEMIIHVPKKEMGNAIKYLKSKFPQADGKMISDIVKEYVI